MILLNLLTWLLRPQENMLLLLPHQLMLNICHLTFYEVGIVKESINSNIDSAQSAVCYSESVNPGANWVSEIHALDYLVYAHLQLGDNKSAEFELKNARDKGNFSLKLQHISICINCSAVDLQLRIKLI